MRAIVALSCVLCGASLVLSAQGAVKSIEDGVLDQIALFVPALERPADQIIVIKPFDASGADLGTGKEGGKEARQQEAKTMQNEGPRVLAESFVAELQKAGAFKQVRVLQGDETAPEGALVVEGKFLAIDPGSRAKRYWAGFGAGKSSVKVSGLLRDGSGRTLATFEQRRVGAMGMYGGDSLGKLMSDARSIGEDIAEFLHKWARNEALK